jgi:hypothetical protein
MLAAKVAIDGATRLLHDADNTRWSRADLLAWLNQGQRQIVLVRPDAKTARGEITLIEGIDQTIPAEGLRLLRITRNVGGRAVTLISEEQLTDYDPTWPTAAAKSVVKHYMHDPREPKAFQTYPPALAGSKVQGVWSLSPVDCANEDSAMDLDAIYEPALVDYILHRAYARDSEDAANAQLAALHRDNFMLALTGKTESDAAGDPRASQPNRIRPNQR